MRSLASHIQNSPGTAAAARTGLARGVDEGLQLLVVAEDGEGAARDRDIVDK